MTTIAYRILKFETTIKRPNMTNHTFVTAVTFSKIYRNSAFVIPNLQNHFHQDNLSFVCLQFYKHSCVNILASKFVFRFRQKTNSNDYFIWYSRPPSCRYMSRNKVYHGMFLYWFSYICKHRLAMCLIQFSLNLRSYSN